MSRITDILCIKRVSVVGVKKFKNVFLDRAKYFLLFVCILFSLSSRAQTQDTEQLRREVEKFERQHIQPDTGYVHLLNKFAESFQYTHLDSMRYYAQRALDQSEKLQYLKGTVEATRLLSSVFLHRGEFKEGVDIAISMRLRIDDTDLESEKALMDQYTGMAYSGVGFFKTGIPFLVRSLEAYRRIGESGYRVVQNLNNLGVAYIKVKNFEKALEIFLELDSMVENKPFTMTVPVNLAYCYTGLKNYKEAKKQCYRVLALPNEHLDPRGFGHVYSQLGKVFLAEGNYAEAIDSFEKSIPFFEGVGNVVDQVPAYDGLAKVYLKQGLNGKAREYATIALKKARESDAMDRRRLTLETNYKVYKEFGEYKKALGFYEAFKSVSDSLQNAELSGELGRLTAEYEFNEKKNELLLQQREKDLENLQAINQQKRLVYAFIVVIAAGAIILFIVYRSYKIKKDHSQTLEEKNKQIEKQSQVLQKTNHVKNRLFSILAHDLRGPLNSLNGLLMLIEKKVTSPKDLELLIPQLVKSFDRNSSLLNNLLNWAASQMDGYRVNTEDFDIVGAIKNDLKLFETRAQKKGVSLHLKMDEPHPVHADKNMIELVMINLVANAIKYCNSGDKVEINVFTNDQTVIKVQDTGIGMDEKTLKTIFTDSFFTTNGTHDEKGTGLGLMLCRDFVRKNGGRLWAESTLGMGSTFYFTLPIAINSTYLSTVGWDE